MKDVHAASLKGEGDMVLVFDTSTGSSSSSVTGRCMASMAVLRSAAEFFGGDTRKALSQATADRLRLEGESGCEYTASVWLSSVWCMHSISRILFSNNRSVSCWMS